MPTPGRLPAAIAVALFAASALGGAGASSVQGSYAIVGDVGVLERFAPQSASTWWAVVESNRKPETFVARTSDSGKHWRNVTPPVKLVSSSFFLDGQTAWVEAEALRSSRKATVYRTLDGGRTWRRLGSVPSECELDFIDHRHGWCVSIGAATGSETVRLVRTIDGGSTWTLVSRTGLYDRGSTPEALPFRCDKTLAFTSPRIGWAASYCAGGTPYLSTSRDGGARWHALMPVPLPAGLPTAPAGEGLSLPAVSGSRLVLSVEIGGSPRGATAIATSANDGRSWRNRLVPGPIRYWRGDLIDVRHWVLSDGTALLATDDAGRHWRRWTTTVRMKDSVGATLALDFLSPHLGFAVADTNPGPLWWTRDGGTTWSTVKIAAGPFTLPG